MSGRPKNKDLRPREYLTNDEIELLLKTAKKTCRDPITVRALVLVGYRHGFRVSELINLKWHHLNLDNETIQVVRSKNGNDSEQPLGKKETRLLRKIKNKNNKSPYVFISMYKMPFTRSAIQKIIRKLGIDADFAFPLHPHMLRHSLGFHLVNKNINLRIIQSAMGHKSISTTETYTALNNKALHNGFKTAFPRD